MKTTFNYDHYYTYEEMTNCLNQLIVSHKHIATMESICTTLENKEVWAITITNPDTGSAFMKPAYYIDGNHHAGEVTGSMAAMHTIDYMLTNYGVDKQITNMIDTMTIYVIPKISPDGSDAYLTTPMKLRSVNRSYPTQEAEDGLHIKDIDQDGHICMMRIKSPYGAWKVSSEDERVMVKRQPDDMNGTFYHVFPEGEIKNYDGLHIPACKPKWGLDFNRNYPFGWFCEARQQGAGKYPLSNPENKAVADFVIAHPNIGFVATMHTSGGVLVYPPGTKPSKDASASDMNMYKTIGKMAEKEMGYPVVNIFDNFLSDTVNYASGAFDDWCYHTQGIPAYTVELWNVKQRAGCGEQWPVKAKTDDEKAEEYFKILQWLDEFYPEGIIPWKKVSHKQLKDVEVGGIDFKFTCQNCPPNFLLQEVEKTTKFVLRNALCMPKLVCDELTTEKIANDVYKITAIISNAGYLPTYICEEALAIEVNEPIKATLQGEFTMINDQGKTISIKGLEGFGTLSTGYSYDGIETDLKNSMSTKISWIIKCNQTQVTLSITSKKAGTLSKVIKL